MVAHPFSTLTVTFNSIAHKVGLPQTHPAFARLETVYLEAWAGVATPTAPARAARLARVFGCLNRALNWERALVGVSEEELGQYGDAVAGWLIEFAERFDALNR